MELPEGFVAHEQRCGTCRLWRPNFYHAIPAIHRGTGCCADVKLDLPASWSSNTPMLANDGADCCAWEANEKPAPSPPNLAEDYAKPWDEPRSYESRDAWGMRVHGLTEDDIP